MNEEWTLKIDYISSVLNHLPICLKTVSVCRRWQYSIIAIMRLLTRNGNNCRMTPSSVSIMSPIVTYMDLIMILVVSILFYLTLYPYATNNCIYVCSILVIVSYFHCSVTFLCKINCLKESASSSLAINQSYSSYVVLSLYWIHLHSSKYDLQ